MTIIFICGCLEMGKDGVGDYTRMLAANLIVQQQVKVSIVALHDSYVSRNIIESQTTENISIKVLRISAQQRYKQQHIALVEYIDQMKPTMVSLQFVPYGFHKKGIPIGLAHGLAKLKVKKWHIMFHELWVGMEKKDTYRAKLIGKVQKEIIRSLVKLLKPIQIHTSNQLYKYHLFQLFEKNNISTLPLFSNISRKKTATTAFYFANDTFNVVLFGTIHHGARLIDFLPWLKREIKDTELKPFITFVGDNGIHLMEWKTALENENIDYQCLSRQSEDDIAEILQQAQLGVTTTPYYLTDKSGAVAAMVKHHLPVLCVARLWEPIIKNELLESIKPHRSINWHNNLTIKEVLAIKLISNSVAEVTNLFLKSITK